MELPIHQVIAFSAHPLGGNPAFVIELQRNRAPVDMRLVAGQFGAASVVVTDPQEDETVRLQFFTGDQVSGPAGHATQAAAHVALGNRQSIGLRFPDDTVRTVRRDGDRISIPWPEMAYEAVPTPEMLEEGLGIVPEETLVSEFCYFAVLRSEQEVLDLVPVFERLSALERTAVAATAPGETSDIVIRVFAPRVGLPEDPVCGTAHRAVVPYWARRLGRPSLHSRHLSPRGGDLWCVHKGRTVEISGRTVEFLQGRITLPDAPYESRRGER
jgi:predicted PhzF superfamily epimerase YddE/YHI9